MKDYLSNKMSYIFEKLSLSADDFVLFLPTEYVDQESAVVGLATWFYNHSYFFLGKSPLDYFICECLAREVFKLATKAS